ncbi:hypothetical protein RFI_12048 [Reticulomyxa filosa]|uniref:Alpha-N-acetylglucosaminidase N-terminal domain-containing protein n=1 Tax=Reticulomyxa filosa TaxID=46433 RepID=X6NFJ8_RETFI|nr:hypothetical protein RFI_12048 [Reticulomyxa filosa]|eukprot:ETO25095.1 hypothetical protein RFI_12048 [Reticulomyxa filosa]
MKQPCAKVTRWTPTFVGTSSNFLNVLLLIWLLGCFYIIILFSAFHYADNWIFRSEEQKRNHEMLSPFHKNVKMEEIKIEEVKMTVKELIKRILNRANFDLREELNESVLLKHIDVFLSQFEFGIVGRQLCHKINSKGCFKIKVRNDRIEIVGSDILSTCAGVNYYFMHYLHTSYVYKYNNKKKENN